MAAAESALEIPPPQSEVRVPNHGGGSASLCCYSRVQQSNQCKSRSRPPGFTADENICLVPHAVAAPIVPVVGGEASDMQIIDIPQGSASNEPEFRVFSSRRRAGRVASHSRGNVRAELRPNKLSV